MFYAIGEVCLLYLCQAMGEALRPHLIPVARIIVLGVVQQEPFVSEQDFCPQLQGVRVRQARNQQEKLAAFIS
jgi:hypothetical protein